MIDWHIFVSYNLLHLYSYIPVDFSFCPKSNTLILKLHSKENGL